MSIDIEGFDKRDLALSSESTYLAGRLCVAQGMPPEQAYTAGNRAANYSSELIFATLRRMGVIPEDGIDAEQFKRVARSLVQQSCENDPFVEEHVSAAPGRLVVARRSYNFPEGEFADGGMLPRSESAE